MVEVVQWIKLWKDLKSWIVEGLSVELRFGRNADGIGRDLSEWHARKQ